MANITEKEIVSYLKDKIKSIHADAKKYEDLLSAFSSSTPTSKPSKKTEQLLDAVMEETEDVPVKAAKKKTEKLPRGPKPSASKTLEVPAEYSTDLSLGGKIAFALNEIGEGFGQDIANAMAQYEPQSDGDKIFKQIASVLSNLKAKGALNTTKDGRRDKYTLAK